MSVYLVVGVTLVPLVGAAAVDLAKGEIPDAFPLALLAWAVLGRLFGWLPPDWGAAALGLAAGLGAGLLLFALGAMGGGDGKLLAGLGAVVGLRGFLAVLVLSALFGGVFALMARSRRRGQVVFGPAILLGYVGAVLVAILSRSA